MADLRFHDMPDGRKIACRFLSGTMPALVFLPGYMSDMAGSKAEAVFEACRIEGRACLLLDYSGCGQSGGGFADGTLSRWREEVLLLVKAYGITSVILIGSSMGGWLMLLAALALGDKVSGLVGIAPAPDFTDWGIGDKDKQALEGGRVVLKPNQYGPEPTPTYPGFYTDAQQQLLLDTAIAIHCPVRLLHGQRDPDVPWQVSLRLAEALQSRDVEVTLIKDGDHRLSRDEDIARLLRIIAALVRQVSNDERGDQL